MARPLSPAAPRSKKLAKICSASLRNSSKAECARQLRGHRNFEIDTSHDPMITEPRRAADWLLEITAD